MRYANGVALVVAAAVLWSGMGLAVRTIGDAGTWAVLFWRSAGMIPVLIAYVAWRSGGVIAPLRAVGWAGVGGGIGLVLAFVGAIYALQHTTVANAMFLYSSAPFFAAVLGWLVLGEKVRPATWASIGLAGVGVALMVGDGLSGGAFLGNMAAIMAALGFALFTVALRWGKLSDMMSAVTLGGLFSILVAMAAMALTGETPALSPPDVAIASVMGAVMLGGGMVLYTLGSRVVPAAESTLLTIVEVMLGPFWVWMFLGEQASPETLTGGLFMVAAVVVNALTGARRAATLALPPSS